MKVLHWVVVAGAFIAGVLLFGLAFAASVTPPSPSPTLPPTPSPSPWPTWITPGDLQMPAGSDCAACHEVSGGVIGIKDIPAIPHPVQRWNNCTECHDNARLVQTAPGHSGIHADQCQICHTVSLGPAPPPAHLVLPDADCLACHGVTAPLPADMKHRSRQYCWLCHLSSNASPSPIVTRN
jgi:hypothetical protein